jgi:hypothetical protein
MSDRRRPQVVARITELGLCRKLPKPKRHAPSQGEQTKKKQKKQQKQKKQKTGSGWVEEAEETEAEEAEEAEEAAGFQVQRGHPRAVHLS